MISIKNSPIHPEDVNLQRRIQQYEEAYRIQWELASQTEPQPVRPDAPLAIVRGSLVNTGQPIPNQVIWIVGEESGETVLYQDEPTGDDGPFEFTDVRVNRPWRIVVSLNNGPAVIAGNSMKHCFVQRLR